MKSLLAEDKIMGRKMIAKKHINLSKCVIVLAILLTLAAGRADSADYWISQTGAGTACSNASPCALTHVLGLALSGSNTIYAKPGTYTNYNVLNDSRYANLSIIGVNAVSGAESEAVRDTVIFTGGADHTFYLTQPGLTLKNLTVCAPAGKVAIYGDTGISALSAYNVYFKVTGAAGVTLIIPTGGTNYVFNRCIIEGNSTDNFAMQLALGAAATAKIEYCIFRRNPNIYNRHSLIISGSGSATISNSVFSGADSLSLYINGPSVTATNNLIMGNGLYFVYPITVEAGELNIDTSLILPSTHNASYYHSGANLDTYTDTNKGKIPIIASYGKGGFLIPCIDDSDGLSYAVAVKNLLSAAGLRGTYYVNTDAWNTENNAVLRGLVSDGTMEVASHTRSHSDLTLTDDTDIFTLAGCTVTVSRAMDTITIGGGGSGTITPFKNSTLASIRAGLVSGGCTVSDGVYSSSGATGKITSTARGEILKEAAAGATAIKLLVDNTAASGYFKSEIIDSKSELEAIIGATVDGQTTAAYACNSLGAPYSIASADAIASAKTAGYTNFRVATGSFLESYNLYNTLVVPVNSLKGATAAQTKINTMALMSNIADQGMVVELLAHNDTELSSSDANGWQAVLAGIVAFGSGVTVTSAQLMARAVRNDDSAGLWSYNASTGVSTRTYPATAVTDFNLLHASPAIDAGTAIDGIHSAGNADVDIGAYEAKCIRQGLPGKIWSDYPPITGTITGGDFSGNTFIYDCKP